MKIALIPEPTGLRHQGIPIPGNLATQTQTQRSHAIESLVE